MIWQIIYGACLAGLWCINAPRSALVPLSCNFIATLAVCGAMDLNWLDRNGATAWMMIVDFTTGVWLLFRPGLPRVVAMFYAITLPVYAATLSFTLPQVVSFGLITAIAFLQLGVVTIDTFTGSGGNTGGKRGRNRILGFCLDLSGGRGKMVQRTVAGDTAARCGGLDGR